MITTIINRCYSEALPHLILYNHFLRPSPGPPSHPPRPCPPSPSLPILPASTAMAQLKQTPTLEGVHIRSADDAHKVFYAVMQNRLHPITKRLDAEERAALKAGDVYVWARQSLTGDAYSPHMERFTEGKSWTASRVRDVRRHVTPIPRTHADAHPRTSSSTTRFRRRRRDGQALRSGPSTLSPSFLSAPCRYVTRSSENRVVRQGEHDQFIKQTYSVYCNDPADAQPSPDGIPQEPKKWHLSASSAHEAFLRLTKIYQMRISQN